MSVPPQPIAVAPGVVPNQFFKGIVKQVLSGDSIIIRGQPKRGPPPERQINLASISAPRLARRPGGNVKIEDAKDEPWAWEAREFMRLKLIGKEVWFAVDYKIPSSGREYGVVLLGSELNEAENITEAIVSAGLATVRREGKGDVSALVELEEKAKAAGIGKWGPDPPESHIRNITWQVENPRSLLDKFGKKQIPAIVEHVRDGSTVRVFLLPSFHYITVMISGIRSPGFKLDADGKPDPSSTEAHADEAKYFTESRLLQADVEVILESVNNSNFVGTIIHPNGNIAELLLLNGFARCIDWSMGFVSGGAEPLRTAEKLAKGKKARIWKDFQASSNSGVDALKPKDKEFYGTVVECINADALVVKVADGTLKKIFLASIRPPRQESIQEKSDGQPKEPTVPKERPKGFRPLYDIPFMYEAREYMRKKLIGRKVHVSVDYIQPASQTFPEKNCCTVKNEGVNIGEALVAKGLATIVRYRQDDDQRSSEYDALLAAEAKAQKGLKGLHGKDTPTHHVIDITGDAAKAKQFLPYFLRAGKLPAVIEYVASGSRLRVYVPRETRLITLLLAGISCPRAGRTVPAGGASFEAEPFGDEALAFTKELCHQREVEIEVDSIDKAGNFIGFVFIEGKNLSVALVDEGLASVHFSAEKTPYLRPLTIAEDNAKARREKIWANYEESKDEIKPEDDKAERKYEPKKVIVTEVTSDLHIFVQFTEDGGKLEALMIDLRRELTEKPPLTGAYTPKKGDICVARFTADNEWYRVKIEKTDKDKVQVLYIDYGNRETIKSSRCAVLPNSQGSSAPPFAKEYTLGFVTLPSDEEYAQDAILALKQDTADCNLSLNIEYKIGGIEYVSLTDDVKKTDVAQTLVREGLLLVENRKERRLQKIVKDFKTAESEAKMKHLNIWQYGDITEDDAREFGMAPARN